jgi:hypothetical protein
MTKAYAFRRRCCSRSRRRRSGRDNGGWAVGGPAVEHRWRVLVTIEARLTWLTFHRRLTTSCGAGTIDRELGWMASHLRVVSVRLRTADTSND